MSGHDAPPTEPVLDPPRRNLIEHRLDELGLGAVRLLVRFELVEPLQRANDRGARGDTIEVVEPDVVREEVRDLALEKVELRQRVLADPEQDVHAQARLGHELGQPLRERALGIVVEEVLLDLVEDQVRVALRRRDRRRRSRSVGSSPHELKIATDESANVRSLCATPARSSELFPTPVGPYRTVSLEASRLATMISRSRSRPKKSSASNGSSSNDARPLYGLIVVRDAHTATSVSRCSNALT